MKLIAKWASREDAKMVHRLWRFNSWDRCYSWLSNL